MDSNYMFLCGVMWCKFGQQEAGKELLRAAISGNPDMSTLAWAMLAEGERRLRDLERAAWSTFVRCSEIEQSDSGKELRLLGLGKGIAPSVVGCADRL